MIVIVKILGYGERDGKMYYKIQKEILKTYSGTKSLLQGTSPMLVGFPGSDPKDG